MKAAAATLIPTQGVNRMNQGPIASKANAPPPPALRLELVAGVTAAAVSALQMMMEGEKRWTEGGTVVWLAGLNPGVMQVARHAGLDTRLGRERMLFNARGNRTRSRVAGGGRRQARCVLMIDLRKVNTRVFQTNHNLMPMAAPRVPGMTSSQPCEGRPIGGISC
jgi:hypothetical protein